LVLAAQQINYLVLQQTALHRLLAQLLLVLAATKETLTILAVSIRAVQVELLVMVELVVVAQVQTI
jgi:hypothetical protein